MWQKKRKKEKEMWIHHHHHNHHQHHHHGKPASGITKGAGNGLVAVAIDKDKGSQYALKWAADTLLNRGQTVILIHVSHSTSSSSSISQSIINPFLFSSSSSISQSIAFSGTCQDAIVCNFNSNTSASPHKSHIDNATRDLFLTFHCYCTRKDVRTSTCFLIIIPLLVACCLFLIHSVR